MEEEQATPKLRSKSTPSFVNHSTLNCPFTFPAPPTGISPSDPRNHMIAQPFYMNPMNSRNTVQDGGGEEEGMTFERRSSSSFQIQDLWSPSPISKPVLISRDKNSRKVEVKEEVVKVEEEKSNNTAQDQLTHLTALSYSLASKVATLESLVRDLTEWKSNQEIEMKRWSNSIPPHQPKISSANYEQSYAGSRPQSMYGTGGISSTFTPIHPPASQMHSEHYHPISPPSMIRANSSYNSDSSFYRPPTPTSTSTPNSSALSRSTSFPSYLTPQHQYLNQQQLYNSYNSMDNNNPHGSASSSSINYHSPDSPYSSPHSSFEKRLSGFDPTVLPLSFDRKSLSHDSPSASGGRTIDLPLARSMAVRQPLDDLVLPARRVRTSFSALAPVVAQAQWLMSQNQAARAAASATPLLHNEYINFRALLESDVDIDVDLFIRRIITQNDQQASIFLQQRLKASTSSEQRAKIIHTVHTYLEALSQSRFGNFLVSRCLEYADEEVVELYMRDLSSLILSLSYDQFGCHVVQKLIDTGGVRARDLVVNELIDHISTLTQRASGHVWSKILSTGLPSSVYQRLAATGSGRWNEIVRDEVGSQLTQLILEGYEGAEGSEIVRDCVADCVQLAMSQWGNFVVSHLIETSSKNVRAQLFDRLEAGYDQLVLDSDGTKTLERMIKHGEFSPARITQFIERICRNPSSAGDGLPLIVDIASHAGGVQLLSLLFTGTTSTSDKDILITSIRKYGNHFKENKNAVKLFFLVEKARTWRK